MFNSVFKTYNWETIKQSVYSKTSQDVQQALAHKNKTLEDFKALVSPSAEPFLEEMAFLSQQITQKRFGKTIQFYAPMYLSNECNNICTYCGFSLTNKIKRKTLTDTEIVIELKSLTKQGYQHILLVTGESNHVVNINYFINAIKVIKPHVSNISIEFQPLELHEYQQLQQLGVHSVLVYQETYHQQVYKNYHTKGKKSNFENRLNTPDLIGEAHIHKIGLGVLLGLEDWRIDSFFCALHLNYLEKKYWQTKFSISFPRMRPAEGIIEPNVIVTDKNMLQLICAYRIFNENVELSLSTRESELFRNHVMPLGITSISAASKTNPGGYVVEQESLEQFETNDKRSVKQMNEVVNSLGYQAVWKDWDTAYSIK